MKRILTLSLAGLLALAATASAHGYGAFRAAFFQPAYAPVYAPAVVAAPVVVQAQAAPCQGYGQILQALAAPPAQVQAAPAAAQPQAAVVQQYAAPAVQAVVTPSYSYGGVAALAAPAYGVGRVRAFAAPVVVRQRVFAQPVVAADVGFVRQAAVVVRRGGVFPTIGRFLFGRREVVAAPGAAVRVRARGVNVVVPGAAVRVR